MHEEGAEIVNISLATTQLNRGERYSKLTAAALRNLIAVNEDSNLLGFVKYCIDL